VCVDQVFLDRIMAIIAASDHVDAEAALQVNEYFDNLQVVPPRTARYNNDRFFIEYADRIDHELAERGYRRVANPDTHGGSHVWRAPPGSDETIWRWCFQNEFFLFGFRRDRACRCPTLMENNLVNCRFRQGQVLFVGVRTQRPQDDTDGTRRGSESTPRIGTVDVVRNGDYKAEMLARFWAYAEERYPNGANVLDMESGDGSLLVAA